MKWQSALVITVLGISILLTACDQNTHSAVADSSGSLVVNQKKSDEAEKAAQEKEALEAARALEEKAQEEAKKAEEARLIAEAIKEQEAIALKTYYAKEGAWVYMEASLQEKSERTLGHQEAVWIKAEVKDENGLLIAYELEAIGEEKGTWYVAASQLKPNKSDWIAMPYEGVSYDAFERNPKEGKEALEVKAVYLTQKTARNDNGRLDELIQLARETEINAFVIDVKNDDGNLLFYSETAERFMPHMNERVAIKDIDAFIKRLKDENIYLIARVVTFKSPAFARAYPERALQYTATGQAYSDRDKLLWASAYDRQLWEYVLGVCEEAAAVGFDEIQFDYVRFPATTKAQDKILNFHNDLNESKAAAIHHFLKEAYERLADDHVFITADVFGWAATSINDVGIGQHWESVSNVVDYIAPMMYPSHYGPYNFGLPVPDAQPYATIDASIKDALKRNANLETPALIRPWIQDFTATWVKGYIRYGAKEVREQIDALAANGIHEFMLWNAGNTYSTRALKQENEED